MANVSYKTIISNAIQGFNGIQNKLNAIGSRYGGADTAYGSLNSISAASTNSPLSITNILKADAFRSGTITVTSGSVTSSPSATAGLSNSANTFPALLDVADTGVVSTGVTGTAGTDYWSITPIISSSSSGTVSAASATVSKSGYMAGTASISNGDSTTVGVSTYNGDPIYVKKLPAGSNSIGTKTNGVYPISYSTTTGGYLPKNGSVSAGTLDAASVRLGGDVSATLDIKAINNDYLVYHVDNDEGIVSTKPSGTAGTDYWYITPIISNYSSGTSGATLTAGYLPSNASASGSIGLTTGSTVEYYLEKASVTLSGNASATLNMIATNASYIAYHSGKSNTGVVSTQPATGDAGEDYWILTPTVSGSSNGSVSAALTCGYIPDGASAGGSVGVSEGTVTSYYLKKTILSGSGGELTGTMSVSSSGSYNNPSTSNCSVSTSSTDNKGVIFTPSFNTSASGYIAVNRADVKYTAVGGYQPKLTTATNILNSGLGEFDGSASSSNNTQTYYITGITVANNQSFPVTMSAASALDTSKSLTVANAAYRNVTVTNAANSLVSVNGMTNNGAAVKIDDNWLITKDSSTSALVFTYTAS